MRLTPSDPRARPDKLSAALSAFSSAGPRRSRCFALTLFTFGVFDESFVDEYAYITQSYYADLYFEGQFDIPYWLDYFAFDLRQSQVSDRGRLACGTPANARPRATHSIGIITATNHSGTGDIDGCADSDPHPGDRWAVSHSSVAAS